MQAQQFLLHGLSLLRQQGLGLLHAGALLAGLGRFDLHGRQLGGDRLLAVAGLGKLGGQPGDLVFALGAEGFQFGGLLLGLEFGPHRLVDLSGQLPDFVGHQRGLGLQLGDLLVQGFAHGLLLNAFGVGLVDGGAQGMHQFFLVLLAGAGLVVVCHEHVQLLLVGH